MSRPAVPENLKRKPRHVTLSDRAWRWLKRRAKERGLTVSSLIERWTEEEAKEAR